MEGDIDQSDFDSNPTWPLPPVKLADFHYTTVISHTQSYVFFFYLLGSLSILMSFSTY